MQVRLITTAFVLASAYGAICAPVAQAYDYTAPVVLHTTVAFDPANGVVPFPNDLLLAGSTDLTLNIPVADPTDLSDPKVAMNALDGFSTTAPWSMAFSTPVDPATLAGGTTLRLFEVAVSGPGGAVTGVVRELASPQEFVVASASSDPGGRTIAIMPTRPLRQSTSYMAVVTDGVRDAAGMAVRASLPYQLAERTDALCRDGRSTLPALPASQACALEPVRQLVNAQEAAAISAGVAPGSIVMSWTATTQSITPALVALHGRIEQSPPARTQLVPSGRNLGDLGLGLAPIADIYIGTIDLPYYLGAPSEQNPTAPLDTHWNAAPGAYVPPFDHAGLDPDSTHVTAANPLPVATSIQTVPLLMTIPNAASGRERPETGWPVVIFQHGITRNRTDMLAIAGTLAAQGFAVVAIDLPLHGITDRGSPFYIANTPYFGPDARERTFDLDLQDNATGAAGADGSIDPSGNYFINLGNLLTSRDNLRQGAADLFELAHATRAMHYLVSGNGGAAEFDTARISFVGQSLGSIVGTLFLAGEPAVNVAVLNVPGGGVARMLDGSPTFGPRIRAGLAASGVDAGTPAYDAFMVAAQTVIDAGDPVNLAGNGTLLDMTRVDDNGDPLPRKRLLLQEVIGGDEALPDQVIPNRVAGAPLSGTEPLIEALGLADIVGTVQDPDGIRGAVRFLAGEHGSLLEPADFPATTAEMQGEMASMLVSDGTLVKVADAAVIRDPQP